MSVTIIRPDGTIEEEKKDVAMPNNPDRPEDHPDKQIIPIEPEKRTKKDLPPFSFPVEKIRKKLEKNLPN